MTVAVAAAIVVVLATVGSAVARSSGGVHTVVVFVPGAPLDLSPYRGRQADMALEVSGAEPSAIEGDMKLGDVIGVHALRSTDAIVLLDPVKGRHGDIPAGVVLARMAFAGSNAGPPTWCDVRSPQRLFFPQEHDCFQDPRGIGRLDRITEADSLVDFLGLSQSGVQETWTPLETPAVYRPARPDERPAATLGFKYCDGDGVTGPPRFAVALALVGERKPAAYVGACSVGVWADPIDRTRVDLNGMILTLSPPASAEPGELHFKISGRLPIDHLALIDANGPVRMAGSRPYPGVLKGEPIFLPTGDKAKIADGEVGVGQLIASTAVKHGVTGVMGGRVHYIGKAIFLKGHSIEAGQPVYGIPQVTNFGDGIAWCAPELRGGSYHAECIVPLALGYSWPVDPGPAMYPNTGWLAAGAAYYSMTDSEISSNPIVQRGPVNLPPMTIELSLTAVTTDRAGVPAPVYHLDYRLDWGTGSTIIQKTTRELPPSGSVLMFFGTPILLKPGRDDQHLVVEAPPSS